ncbi:PAS domain S-box protein [Archangium violaceum]|uniref:PAS domain S-box protein n=1 Tax=Archangium violaceum TaxID=83451 RepID=UPI0006987046|nr:PAS domain S-box protein [Archangium violaceum]
MNFDPHTSESPPPTLADLLESRHEDIIQRWTGRLREGLAPTQRTQAELEDHIGEYLWEMARVLRRQTAAGAEPLPEWLPVAREHGSQRLRIGFDVQSLVREYHVLRESILDLVEETGVRVTLGEVRALSAFITTGIAEGVDEYLRQRDAVQRLSEERLRAMLDQAPAAIFAKDAEGRYLYGNRYQQRLVGRPLGEILGRDDAALFPRPLAEALRLHDAQVLEGHTRTFEEVIEFDTGPRTYLSTKFPLPGGEGLPTALGGISVDITARKQAEQALRESEERFRLLVEGVEDYAVYLLDTEGRILSWNTGAERIMGYTQREVLGRHIALFHPPEELNTGQPDQCLRTAVTRGHCRMEGQRVRKDGSRFWAEFVVTALRDEAGVLRGFSQFTRDIARRKRAEQAQSFFLEAGTLLSQSLDVANTLRKITSLAVRHLCDYCMVDLLGEDGQLHRLELAARDPAAQALIERARPYPPLMGSGSPVSRALENGEALAVPELTPAWLDASARNTEHRAILEALGPKSVALVPLVARGRRLGIINLAWTRSHTVGGFAEDLEVARGLADRAAVAIDNAQLYQQAQEAVRVREDVVAIVSHDLRNPLNAISLSATLLEREAVNERTTRTARRITEAAERASGMIRDLLDFTQARVGGGIPIHPRPLDFHEHVRRVVEEVRLAWPGRRIDFQASGEGQGEADEGRLAQVVTNLVGNALQHSPPGTPVRVSTRGVDSSLLMEVHNEGPAITAELLPMLFEPYRRGAEAGPGRGSLGLGLYITRQIVLGHGGSVDVRSSPEDGTTFTVRLPRSRPPA